LAVIPDLKIPLTARFIFQGQTIEDRCKLLRGFCRRARRRDGANFFEKAKPDVFVEDPDTGGFTNIPRYHQRESSARRIVIT
jgi:hypothetical protein